MKVSRSEALDIFSYFLSGGFLGNVLLGFISDILPMRSPVFELGIITSTILMSVLASADAPSSAVSFCLGAALSGSSIVIAGIECDMGNYVKKEYDQQALGTFSGIIDGFAGIGGVLGQLIIAALKSWKGWRGTYYALAVFTGMSAIPALTFIKFEISQWR